MRFGDYETLLDLGRGGMADLAIAEAMAPETIPPLALVKTLRPPATKERIDMFLDEARLGVLFDHPNVVRTLATGEENDRHYIVMELLDGQPFDRILDRVRKAARFESSRLTLVWILSECLAGLHYAHELAPNGQSLNIVHRDLSPQNVFVTYEGRVKVLDFGIAKSTGRLSQTTNTGEVKGKMRYMAPEHALGLRIDRRADVFAAGILLHELASGRPFWDPALSDREIFDALVAGDYDEVPPVVSAGMGRILGKALARDALERYRTIDEMRQDLTALVEREADVAEMRRHVTELLSQLFTEQRVRLENAIAAARSARG